MKNTHYDIYGGQYVAESLMNTLKECGIRTCIV